jgi:hypothetical protein
MQLRYSIWHCVTRSLLNDHVLDLNCSMLQYRHSLWWVEVALRNPEKVTCINEAL